MFSRFKPPASPQPTETALEALQTFYDRCAATVPGARRISVQIELSENQLITVWATFELAGLRRSVTHQILPDQWKDPVQRAAIFDILMLKIEALNYQLS